MSGATSSDKHERQYEHIRHSAAGRGESPRRAQEIAARTVTKSAAFAGESRSPSRGSRASAAASRGGGQRATSGPAGGRAANRQRATGQRAGGPSGRTRDQLYEEAKARDIKGRSRMTKTQLERAIGR